MGFFNFSTPKPKQFQYRPMFYDERKERLEKMKARAEAELSAGKAETTYTSGLQRGFLSERGFQSKFRRKSSPEKTSSALRFFAILLILVSILYFAMPDIFMAFWKTK